jgi:iron complex transport system ATP-binding protein
LLLLDEPTNHLDIKNQITLLESLMALNQSQNMSIVIAMHDLNLAIKYSDYVIHIDDNGEFTIGLTNDILTIDNIKAWYGVDAELLTSSDGKVINFLRSSNLTDFPV